MDNFYLDSFVQYCERIGNGPLSEPLNLISNLALLASSFFIYRLLKKKSVKEKKYWILMTLVLLIGVGSLLWHSFRNPFTHLLDAIPIYLFLLLALFVALKKLVRKNLAIVLVFVFLITQIIVSMLLPKVFNGSIRHFLNILVFGFLTYLFYKKNHKTNTSLLTAFLLYAIGITFRSIDNLVCASFPMGTHFLWHIFTGATTFYIVRGLLEEN